MASKTVHNGNRKPVTLFTQDKTDSVTIQPKQTIPVDEIFLTDLPDGVSVKKSSNSTPPEAVKAEPEKKPSAPAPAKPVVNTSATNTSVADK